MALAQSKTVIKSIAGQAARTCWPLIEGTAELSAQLGPDRKGLEIRWFDVWNETLNQALETLPTPPGISRDQYRALVQPTRHTKRHALVLENDEPVALISLRKRNQMWEPVSFQSFVGFIAPARDLPTLGRALRALGLDIQIFGGLDDTIFETNPTSSYKYDVARVFLQTPYEEYWEQDKGKHRKHISSARKKCKRMHLIVNQKSDIEWIVSTWRDVWKDSPANETVAAPDRIAFWNTLPHESEDPTELTLQVYTLYDGDDPVAGAITTALGGGQIGQCQVQLKEYRKRGAGTHVLDLSLQHGATAGFEYHDFGGGHGYKSLWGPFSGHRYGASFRPKIFNRFDWVHPS